MCLIKIYRRKHKRAYLFSAINLKASLEFSLAEETALDVNNEDMEEKKKIIKEKCNLNFLNKHGKNYQDTISGHYQ